jgi:hypothetical protein
MPLPDPLVPGLHARLEPNQVAIRVQPSPAPISLREGEHLEEKLPVIGHHAQASASHQSAVCMVEEVLRENAALAELQLHIGIREVKVDGSQRGRFQERVHLGEVGFHEEDVFQIQPGSDGDPRMQASEVKVNPEEVCARFLLCQRAEVLSGSAADLELERLVVTE